MSSKIIKLQRLPFIVSASTALTCQQCHRFFSSTSSVYNKSCFVSVQQYWNHHYFTAKKLCGQVSSSHLSKQSSSTSIDPQRIVFWSAFCMVYNGKRNCLLGNGLLSNLRHYHSPSKFSLQDPLYDSYLQSLLSELKDYELEAPQLSQEMKNEGSRQENTRRVQFLQTSSHVIQGLYDKKQEIEELQVMMDLEEDKEMKSFMENEMASLRMSLMETEHELVDILVGNDPADSNSVVLEVSAGVGGQEAMLFCAEVFNMYWNYSLANGWEVMAVGKDEVELGGYRKASIEISGTDVYKYLKHEAGVHRVQRVPKTEKAGRIHTSTISVSVIPQPREIDIQIDKKDLKIETFRGSGPGGQSVNTTDSAVRITHIPTGNVAECRQERSQIKNKDIAMGRLKLRMYQIQLEKEEAQQRATRKMQMGTRSRSEKIRTYNFQQDRITDHRVKESQSNLLAFMSGGDNLDNMISKVVQDYKYQVLESMLDEFELSVKKQCNKT